jgi:predicted Zn-dependent protease
MSPLALPIIGRILLAGLGIGVLLSCSGSGGDWTALTTPPDNERIRRDSAEAVETTMGLVGDKALDAYMESIGRQVLRGLRKPRFEYSFQVINEVEPNAFVLPDGSIYVSRGLLAFGNNEDELACVLGHEIAHAEKLHVARPERFEDGNNPLLSTWRRAVRQVSYSPQMEREADDLGQRLCAAAGYDPMGLSSFLQNLRRAERVRFGFSRQQSFLETHPGLQERAAVNAARAGKISWKRDPESGDPRLALLRRIDGLDIGERPQSGVFVENRFFHPVLDFQITFPAGWELSVNNRVVGARSRATGAIVYLTADQAAGDPWTRGEEWLARFLGQDLQVEGTQSVSVGRNPAWRAELSAGGRFDRVTGTATFISYGDQTFRLMTVAATRAARAELRRALTAVRSFRRLSVGNRELVRARRLRIVEAEAGESLADLGRRTEDTWVPTDRALVNGLLSNHVFAGGELVKVARSEAFPFPWDRITSKADSREPISPSSGVDELD